MKAVRLLEYGGQLVFNDVPTPTIAHEFQPCWRPLAKICAIVEFGH